MSWEGTDDQHRALLTALREVKGKNGLSHLETSLGRDQRTRERAHALQLHKDKPVNRTTLFRWIKNLDPDPAAPISDEHLNWFKLDAKYGRKQLVYDFLIQSAEVRTSLFKPVSAFPKGLLDYLVADASRLAKPFDKDLSKLDGAFELYRPAWTTPHRRDRVLVSRLLFTIENDFTRFREEQDYIDPEFQNARVRETDEGAVFFTAANIILLGFGMNEERVKLYAASSWFSSLSGELPVTRLSGSMMGVSGRRDQKGYPFVAVRSPKAFGDITTEIVPASDPRFDDETKAALRLEAPK